MLNELRQLARALDTADAMVEERHKSIQPMPKGVTFVLGIGPDGGVVWCEERRNPSNDVFLVRIESGNAGESFPGFNLNYNEKKRGILEKCLRTLPERIAEKLGEIPEEFKSFGDLLERCATSKLGLDGFLEGFREAVEKANLSPTAKSLIEALDKTPNTKVSVFLEIDRPGDYAYPIAHPKTAEFLNRRLLEKMPGQTFATGGKGSRSVRGRSAYGEDGEIETRFPQPTLPVLGKVTLFSMSAEHPCQTRYGRIESDAFPVTKPTAAAMMNALVSITSQEREGKTWTAVPSPADKKKGLLIAYLDGRPETDALFASFFGEAAAGDDPLAEARFEEACASVVRAIEGIPAGTIDAAVRVLVLSKADRGRTKVVLSEAYRPNEIRAAAERWREGARNVPSFDVYVPVEKGKPAERRAPRPPFPAEVMRALNTVWLRGAKESADAPGCSLADVHRALLRGDKAAAERLLGIAVRRFPALLVPVGAADHKNGKDGLSVPARRAALVAVPVLGILLRTLERKKEDYMESAPYAIGRLLSLVDQLHALYCEKVREGSMPNQLLGNALMATALERPRTALDLLAQRILPYQAWARVSKGEKAGLAHWFLNEIGGLSARLHEVGIPERTAELDRAEMLLGYLAKTEKKERSEKEVAA